MRQEAHDERLAEHKVPAAQGLDGADDGTRTRDPHLGKAAAAVHVVTLVPATCGFVHLSSAETAESAPS